MFDRQGSEHSTDLSELWMPDQLLSLENTTFLVIVLSDVHIQSKSAWSSYRSKSSRKTILFYLSVCSLVLAKFTNLIRGHPSYGLPPKCHFDVFWGKFKLKWRYSSSAQTESQIKECCIIKLNNFSLFHVTQMQNNFYTLHMGNK